MVLVLIPLSPVLLNWGAPSFALLDSLSPLQAVYRKLQEIHSVDGDFAERWTRSRAAVLLLYHLCSGIRTALKILRGVFQTPPQPFSPAVESSPIQSSSPQATHLSESALLSQTIDLTWGPPPEARVSVQQRVAAAKAALNRNPVYLKKLRRYRKKLQQLKAWLQEIQGKRLGKKKRHRLRQLVKQTSRSLQKQRRRLLKMRQEAAAAAKASTMRNGDGDGSTPQPKAAPYYFDPEVAVKSLVQLRELLPEQLRDTQRVFPAVSQEGFEAVLLRLQRDVQRLGLVLQLVRSPPPASHPPLGIPPHRDRDRETLGWPRAARAAEKAINRVTARASGDPSWARRPIRPSPPAAWLLGEAEEDSVDDELADRILADVPQQVDWLLDEATSLRNLSQMYEGWCSWV